MKRILTIVCAAAALAAPAAADAAAHGNGQAHQDAVKTCKALRKAAGKANFASIYGKKGLGRCIKQETKENKAEAKQGTETAQQNAAKQCKAERDADPQAFQQTYGKNKNGKNAFGKCVSQHARANEQQEEQKAQQADDDQVSAASECRDERKADPEAFAAKYGTNHNKRNAFGKCVSTKAKAKGDSEQQS
jgi:hypothetical protein